MSLFRQLRVMVWGDPTGVGAEGEAADLQNAFWIILPLMFCHGQQILALLFGHLTIVLMNSA